MKRSNDQGISHIIARRMARMVDRPAPPRLGPIGWSVVAAALVAIIIPSLFLPLGPDEALFLVSGQKILRGAVHYRDIIDIKPPLIYHLYALGALGFGSSEIAIRIFDSLIQLATCWLMIDLVRRATRNDAIALLAPMLYLLLYIGQGYGAMGQAESYAGIFGVAILQLLLFHRSRRALIVAGALAGTLALFKFTLAIVLAGAILGELTLRRGSLLARLRSCGWIALGFAIVAGAFLLYLTATGAMANFLLVNRFLRGYAAIELGSASAWLRNLLRGVAVHFSDNYSLILFIATAGGIGIGMLRSDRAHDDLKNDGMRDDEANDDATRDDDDDASSIDLEGRLLRLSTIFFLLLLVSVAVEGKFYHYHFSRIYPFGAMLAAAGLARGIGWIGRRLASAERGDRGYGMMMTCVLLMALLIIGPLPRYAWQCAPMAAKLRGGDEALDRLYDRIGAYYPRSELRKVGTFLAERRRANDRIYAGSSIAALVYYFAGYVPDVSIYHSAFYMARFAPAEFKERTRSYLLTNRPRFIVTQINDTTADITGVRDATSASALRALPGIDSLLKNEYRVAMRTKFFEVMEGND